MWTPGLIFGWVALAAVAVVFLAYLKSGQHKSDQASLAIWLVMNLLMKLAAPVIYDLCVEHRQFSNSIWYLSWAMLDFSGVFIIWYWHKRFSVNASKLTGFISMSFVMLAITQLLGFLDREILATKSLDELYRFLILAINFAVAPMAIYFFMTSSNVLIKGFHK